MSQAPEVRRASKPEKGFDWLHAVWDTRYRWAPPILLSLFLLALWDVAIILTQISPLTLPRPWDVAAVSVSKASMLLRHSLVTGLEVVLGFAIATVVGTVLGVVISSSRLLGNAIYPILVGTQVMPKIAIAPLLIIWFGYGISSKLVLTALIAFFPIVINTIVGLNMTRQQDIYLFRSMGANQWQTFWKLRLPNALPVFFGGLKVAATLSVIGAVVGEFTGAETGLGYVLMVQVGHLETATAFASVLYLTLLGLLVFLVVAILERLLVPAHMLRRFETQ